MLTQWVLRREKEPDAGMMGYRHSKTGHGRIYVVWVTLRMMIHTCMMRMAQTQRDYVQQRDEKD